MNQRTNRLAGQAGFDAKSKTVWAFDNFDLDYFAELIRQDEREQILHTYLKLTLEDVIREREACAKLCEKLLQPNNSGAGWVDGTYDYAAEAIRQRGEK